MVNKKTPLSWFEPDNIIRENLNGFGDPDQSLYSFIRRSAILKDSHDAAEAEYTDAYLRALLMLAAVDFGDSQENMAAVRILSGPEPVAVPALFICHHVVELSLKSVIFHGGQPVTEIHKIRDLWKDADLIIKKKIGDHSAKSLWKFVKFVGDYDTTSTVFRYPFESYDSPHAPQKPLAINLKDLHRATAEFVETLRKAKLIPTNPIASSHSVRTPFGTAIVEDKQ